jgi:DNA repair exonuclease SbcCD ATPase subunit
MTKEIIIIALLLLVIYLYYQNQKSRKLSAERIFVGTDNSTSQTLMNLLNVNSLEELKTKLGSKTLDELIEENEDYETEVDTLTRTKISLEQDLTAQAESFQARIREKDRENKKLKEDLKSLEKVRENLTSEKQQHKGSLERIKLLTEQIANLEQEKQELSRTKSPIPGEFPSENELLKSHQEQLRKINSLFDENAKDYQEIDFNGLYSLLETIAEEQKKN